MQCGGVRQGGTVITRHIMDRGKAAAVPATAGQSPKGSEEAERSAVMLVSRHRIGEYLPEVAHRGPDPAAVALCREVLAESGAECVILHGSRGWGGWDEQSDLNVIVIHHSAGDKVERERLRGQVVRVKERRYRGSSDYKADLESGPGIVTSEFYAARRRTLNHSMARAARAGTIFPKESEAEDRYRHDGDTSDEWELVTAERLRLAASRNRGIAFLQEMHRFPHLTLTCVGFGKNEFCFHDLKSMPNVCS